MLYHANLKERKSSVCMDAYSSFSGNGDFLVEYTDIHPWLFVFQSNTIIRLYLSQTKTNKYSPDIHQISENWAQQIFSYNQSFKIGTSLEQVSFPQYIERGIKEGGFKVYNIYDIKYII